MRICVGGGSGFIGRRLVNALQGKGHSVTIISRKEGPGHATWSDIERHGLPDQCDAVVNLAGENLMNPLRRWNDQFKADLETSRIVTNTILSQAISAASIKPSVFVATSAVGYYEPSSTTEYIEDSDNGLDYLAYLCHNVEESARLPDECNVRQSIIRIGLVLGREGGIIQNMYFPFALGTGGRIGSGKQWFPWIHIDDVTGIFCHVLENPSISGVFNAVSPGITTNEDFTQIFASAFNKPAFFPVPGFMLNLIFGKERANAMLSGQKVLPRRTLDSGYHFIYTDLKSAISECVKK